MSEVRHPTLTVCKVDPLSPTSYCFACGYLLKPGEEIWLKSIPIFFRYGKQRKKAKGNTNHVHKEHVKCRE